MDSLYTRHCGWWDWRLSSRFRAASAGSIWLLILGSPFLGPLLVPLGVVRLAAGTAQFFLNHQLGKLQPVGPRGKLDWWLLGLTLLAAMAVARINELSGSESTLLLIPVALPFTAIQVRMCRRSALAFARKRQLELLQADVMELPLAA